MAPLEREQLLDTNAAAEGLVHPTHVAGSKELWGLTWLVADCRLVQGRTFLKTNSNN